MKPKAVCLSPEDLISQDERRPRGARVDIEHREHGNAHPDPRQPEGAARADHTDPICVRSCAEGAPKEPDAERQGKGERIERPYGGRGSQTQPNDESKERAALAQQLAHPHQRYEQPQQRRAVVHVRGKLKNPEWCNGKECGRAENECAGGLRLEKAHESREERHGERATQRSGNPRHARPIGDRQHGWPSRGELRIHAIAQIDNMEDREELTVRGDREREASGFENSRLKQLHEFINQERRTRKDPACHSRI